MKKSKEYLYISDPIFTMSVAPDKPWSKNWQNWLKSMSNMDNSEEDWTGLEEERRKRWFNMANQIMNGVRTAQLPLKTQVVAAP